MPLHRHCATGYASWAFEPQASGRPWLTAGYQLAQQLSLFRALFIRIFINFSSAYIVLKGYTITIIAPLPRRWALAPLTRQHLSASCCHCSDSGISSTPPHGSTCWPAATPLAAGALGATAARSRLRRRDPVNRSRSIPTLMPLGSRFLRNQLDMGLATTTVLQSNQTSYSVEAGSCHSQSGWTAKPNAASRSF